MNQIICGNLDALNNVKQQFTVLYADPPWSYSDKRFGQRVHKIVPLESGSFAPESGRYKTMNLDEIKKMGHIIKKISEKKSVLFMWVTSPLLKDGIEVMKEWGFIYKTIGFVWEKESPTLGQYTLGSIELCLLGTTKKIPNRLSQKERQLVVASRTGHSSKPDEVRRRIERIFSGPRIELFAREQVRDWYAWGNQVEKGKNNILPIAVTGLRI